MKTIDTKGIMVLLFVTAIVAAVATFVFFQYTLPATAPDQAPVKASSPNGFVQLRVTEGAGSNTGRVNINVAG